MAVASELVAAVDLGSNSFHLIVGRQSSGEFRTFDRVKDRVQLSAGLGDDGRLTRETIDRGLDCVRRFAQRLQGVTKVRAVATSALREASNRAEFLKPASALLGCPIDVISGEEEGRLIYLGVAHVLADDEESRLVVDIGGGSTELVVGQRFRAHVVKSLSMGCVSITRRYLSQTADLGRAYAAAHNYARAVLEDVRDSLGNDWRHVAGSSGTIESVQEVLRTNGWGDDLITREGMEIVHDHLLECRSPMDLSVSGLTPDRVDIFPGGFAVLLAVFRALNLNEMEYADGTMLDGVLYDLLGSRGHENVRDRTMLAMQARYDVDRAQAARIESLAITLFDRVADCWGINEPRYRQLLCWAAQLHEIGLAMSSTHVQRHGAYLIDHTEMRGFNHPRKRALAALVRSHRGAFPKLSFAAFPPLEQQRLMRLAVLLRLAYLFGLSRSDKGLPRLVVKVDRDQLELGIAESWMGSHALSASRLHDERIELDVIQLRVTLY